MSDFDVNRFFRPDLLSFPPYRTAGLPLADLDRIIKLDANENPYGPSPKALAALAAFRHWGRYAVQDELRPAIAQYAGVDAGNIVVGNGADEVIDLVQSTFLGAGDAMLDSPPTFEMYSHYAQVAGVRTIEVPRRQDFSLDVDAIEDTVTREHPKMLFVTNPNNPDGGLVRRGEIERLLALPVIVVLDEAYAEFSGESIIRRVLEQPNLVVLRTFSKWAGLAGLRIGYCAAPARIADQMMRIKSPYNVNAAAIVAAKASLEDADYLLGNVRRIVQERERLFRELCGLEYLAPLPSRANFILCQVKGIAPLELRERLAERNILVRAFRSPRLQDRIRISVGTPEQDDTLLRALKEIGGTYVD